MKTLNEAGMNSHVALPPRWKICGLACLALGLAGTWPAWAEPATVPPNLATTPVPRNDWMDRHNRNVQYAATNAGPIDVVLIGDSITEAWGGRWGQNYQSIKAANLGINGDCTQHVLWRLQNGTLGGLRPRVVILLVGTNNCGRAYYSNQQIFEGVAANVNEILKQRPETKVLLLGLFPRGLDRDTPAVLPQISEVNCLISTLHDGKHVFYLDIGEKFIQPDGKLTRELQYDYLHLTDAGYKIWSDAMRGPLMKLLGT